ncbi:ComEC/Rec2 family competence protein [Priestia aryabhattai]|uniref:ComEC/Rec2 family competence protein n=1 Tax=Priestia aryabhattai TaxID=412384 RepID=UPI001CCC13C5|nr:MBL fold metallo-hydrolase [Priestia aryabhattai]MBZ6485059.1 MBL fold metallo-hydrolase [Priestia aryabhattai]
MSTSKQPNLTIESINVGHGDCTLISWDNGSTNCPWHCLIDSGDGAETHVESILNTLEDLNVRKIDLAIVSHFDSDHIKGFNKICDNIKISQYWSPYTPAFKKYLWLFGDRGKLALERANHLEQKLAKKNVEMLSPLDGYVTSPIDNLRISVFSPSSKFYERLLAGDRVKDLFETYPTPIGTILNDNVEYVSENYVNPMVLGFSNRRDGEVIKRNLTQEEQELNNTRLEKFSINKLAVQEKQELGPEFFGNHILNDTSLVIKFEVWTGTRWFSLLFPGDLENWDYVMCRHQSSLYSDYYKVSHHGGRVYVNRKEAADAVIQAIRPTVAAINANGKHNLPRMSVREALVRWSSSTFCSLNRGCEKFQLDGSLPYETKCCKEMYSCQTRQGNFRVKVTGQEMKTNVQACQRVYTPNRLPVIQFEQHIVQKSEVLTSLNEREIEKHTFFTAKQLQMFHQERVKASWTGRSNLITVSEIQAKLVEGKRFLTENQIHQIYKYGYMNNKFWAKETKEYGSLNSWKQAYMLPKKEDLNQIRELVLKNEMLFVPVDELVSGLTSLIQKVERDNICSYLEKKTMFPRELIGEYIWPLLTKDIIKNYKIIYFHSEFSRSLNWLVMVRKGEKNYNELMEGEVKKFFKRKAPFDGYNSTEEFGKYMNGADNVKILSIINGEGKTFRELGSLFERMVYEKHRIEYYHSVIELN